MPIKTIESAAVLTIRFASEMTDIGKKDIARWLRREANRLLKDGFNYSNRYTARYLYGKEE